MEAKEGNCCLFLHPIVTYFVIVFISMFEQRSVFREETINQSLEVCHVWQFEIQHSVNGGQFLFYHGCFLFKSGHIMKSLIDWLLSLIPLEHRSLFLSNVLECSNIRPCFGYSYYSNEYYKLITYGASDRRCNMDPYGRHSRNNDNKTKFRVISECICF